VAGLRNSLKEFRATDYQSKAIPEMVRGDYMLVWDPGTGKTYPTIIAADYCGGPHLTICPAHLRDQWASQVERFTPWSRVRILEKTKEPADLDGADFVICSYEYVTATERTGKTAIPRRWRELRRHKWASMAWDEAHALMHDSANRTRALLGANPDSREGLAFAAERVWPLTGTPFTFPNEAFPIVSRLFPGATKRDGQSGYMTAREWENRFCVTKPVVDQRTGRSFGEKVVGAQNVPELRRRLAPYLSKVRLSDIHDRGEIIDTVQVRGDLRGLLKGLDPETLAQYEALSAILENDEIPEGEKLRALGDNSGLVMAQLRHHIAVAKINPTLEIVRHEAAKGVDKILVFGWHREPLKAFADKLGAPLIYGTMPKRSKARALESFLTDPKCKFLAGQIGAIGTGTDGLQDVCRRSFFMESSWAYRDNKQARHRTYRMGQRFDAHTTFISLRGSVDEYVARVLARNADTVSRVLD
jgi:superfamily II DNA or RNA helicase